MYAGEAESPVDLRLSASSSIWLLSAHFSYLT